jgi:hypothetical protein
MACAPVRSLMQLGGGLDRLRGVVGEQRRHLQRDPTVDPIGGVENGAKQACRGFQVFQVFQVFQRESEERLLGGFALAYQWSWPIACSKMVGFEVSPVTENSAM